MKLFEVRYPHFVGENSVAIVVAESQDEIPTIMGEDLCDLSIVELPLTPGVKGNYCTSEQCQKLLELGQTVLKKEGA